MKTVWIALFVMLIAGASPAWAQDAAYVSRLVAQPGPQSVLLTWKDAEGARGAHYEVWRSDQEIVKDTLAKATLLATVNAGTEAYEDTSVTGPSFYLVLLRDASGAQKAFFIPFRNKTTTAVKPSGGTATAVQIQVQSVTYASPQILVGYQATPADRKLLVFRRPGSIKTLNDLKDATILGTVTGAQSPYQDTPPPGLEFYYAVVDAQGWTDGKAILQSDNVTDHAVGFPLVALPPDVQNSALDASLRPSVSPARALPLPRLDVDRAPDTGAALVAPAYQPEKAQPLTPGTQTVLKQWSKAPVSQEVSLPPAVVLPEERSATEDGAGRYLVQIQEAYLGPEDWKGAINALQSVLKLPLEPRTEARARYYLGVAEAHQKDYQQAFLDLLSARGDYPSETGPFLEAVLSLLEATPE